jgi:hypothetical protein
VSATPFSYRQYAGNGSTTTFSVPFPYLLKAHVKVYIGFNILDGTFSSELADGVGFSWTSGTQIQTTTPPASGQTLTVIRQTPNTTRLVDWQDGSNLIASDLDTADLQNLYVVQELQDKSDAGVAQSNAAAAAATAATTASTAASTSAATALSQSTTALSQSSTALTQSSTALSQSSTALTNAATALSTANSASSTAASAAATATSANAKADSAITAISTSAVFTPVANVAAIPASPTGGQAIQVTDSTGIESFTPLSGLPGGFVGDSGLSARIQYNAATSSWVWFGYFAATPDTRYLRLTGGTLTGQLKGSSATTAATPNFSFDGDADTGLARLGANELALVTGGTARLTFDSGGNAAFTGPVTIPAGSTVTGYLDTATASSTYQTQAGMSSYLTTASASSTYQTQAAMSGYLATSAIGTTVQSYDADTAKTDVAQTFTAAQRGAYVTLTDAATIATDLSLGNQFQVTLGGNRTLGAPTNVVAGQSGVIRVVQDGTGSRTLAYNSVFKFPGGTAPTLTTTANAVDLLAYHCETTTRIAVRFIGDVK